MSAYISPTNEYPRHIGDIQAEHPNYKEGDALPAGWFAVEPTETPTPGIDELVYEAEPLEVDGVWTQQWAVRALTVEEIERRDAPKTAKAKLVALGLNEAEVDALVRGLVR